MEISCPATHFDKLAKEDLGLKWSTYAAIDPRGEIGA